MNFDDATREVDREDAIPVTALEELEAQAEIAGSYGFNLNALWRTVGRPEDKTPAAWLTKPGGRLGSRSPGAD